MFGAQNPRVSAEAGLPQSVAQDDDLGRAGFALFGQEVTAYGGLYPQNLEIVAGNLKAANPLGLGYGSKLEAWSEYAARSWKEWFCCR